MRHKDPLDELDPELRGRVEGALAKRDAEIRADERKRIVADLRWLAEKRDTYGVGAPPQIAAAIDSEVNVAKLLAAIVEGTNDGWGWLPSLYWTDWEEKNRG